MSRSALMIALTGLAIVCATVWGTQYLLGLFVPGSEPGSAAGEAKFLAHLLLPLSVALAIFVAITLVAGGLRLVRRIAAPDDDPEI